MAENSLYPGFVLIKYSVATRPHKMILPVLPVLTAGGDYNLTQKNSLTGDSPWQGLVQDWLDTIDVRWNEGDIAISTAELWTLADVNADPVYRDAFTPTDPTGGGASTVSYSETVMTFRTLGGGILRIYQMETVGAVNSVSLPPTYGGSVAAQGILAFLLSDDNFIVGRDGTFPVAGIRLTTKTSDALRKKYLL